MKVFASLFTLRNSDENLNTAMQGKDPVRKQTVKRLSKGIEPLEIIFLLFLMPGF